MKAAVHNVGSWVARWARLRGSALAVADPERRLDYLAFEERTARLAGWLDQQGVQPGDRVAILLANRTSYLEAVFASARLGALAVPVNTRLAVPEIRYLLDDCRPGVLIHEHALSESVEGARAEAKTAVLCLPVGGDPDAYEATLRGAAPHYGVHPVSPDDPMMLMYTSGTSGAPKGALLPHRKTLFNSLNAQLFFATRPDDRVLVVAPLFHSLGLLILSLPGLYAGAGLVLQRGFAPEAVWRSVEQEGIAYLGGVPTMYQRLFDLFEAEPDLDFDLSSLRFLFTAGAAIPADLVRGYAERDLVLMQGYGQTETSILCCLDPADALRKAGSVGRPVFHAEIRCVAAEGLEGPPSGWRETAPGETGELVVRGPITMLGYWERPEESAATLREEGWLRTGDLATRDVDGFVTLAGRARDLFISGGENVYPAEVEAAFAEHPSVREIAVVGVPDERWGEVGLAYVVPASGSSFDPDALLGWGRERLASYKLPRSFVEVEQLPKTASGKVQKHRLLRR